MKKDKQRLFEVMQHLNPDFKKINENTEQLTNQDQQVLSMLLGETINEAVDFKSFFQKYKSAIQKGLVTAGVLTALLSNPSFSQEQKQQIQNLTQTEQGIGGEEKKTANLKDRVIEIMQNVDGSHSNYNIVNFLLKLNKEYPYANIPSNHDNDYKSKIQNSLNLMWDGGKDGKGGNVQDTRADIWKWVKYMDGEPSQEKLDQDIQKYQNQPKQSIMWGGNIDDHR